MAFDQNSISMDLSPINIGRSTVIEESRINAPPTSGRNNNTTEGFYANSTSPGSMPVYYPASDGNAAVPPGWVQRIPPAVVSAPGITSPSGYCYRLPNVPNRVGGNCSDKASDEGGDDFSSGKKIKFLCSFGGKILPRPSDGALRYVGGHTRIISVSRDVGFNQLVQKLGDLYGQNVVIKYQLPEEDLDALVSVSCPDDLDNMMDEYEKMLKRSLDKSAKLRVFLFLASDLDSSGIIQMGDFQDSGQEYVEAVNGIMDGLGIGSIMRESITSAASTQISESSGNEAIDHTGGHGQIDFTGPPSTGGLSPKNGPATTQEASPVCVDPNPTISVAPLGIQMVRPPLPTVTTQPVAVVQPQQQQQTGFDMLQQQREMGFPPRASYLQAYVDPQQEALNHTNYVQYPSQMGFPAQLLGTVGPMFTQQQYRDNAVNVSPHQFIPAIHMTMTPSSHASITKNAVQPIVQPQQNTYGHRVVHVPGDQSYNIYHAQVAPAVMGGYGWHQAPQPDQITFSELPHQEVLTEKVPRFNDCYMCQKALPHAHSDTEVQAQKDSPTATMPDFNSVHHSLQLEDNIRGQQPLNKAAVTGPMGEGIVENQVAGTCSRVLDHMDHEAIKAQYGGVVVSQNFKNDRTVLQREENHEPLVPQRVVGLASGPQCPYGAFVGTVPQLYQENVIQKPMVPPTQYQEVKEEALMNKAVNVDNASGGDTASQTSDHLVVNESPKVYSDNLPASVPKESMRESSFAYDQLRQIDGRMENLGVRPSEFFLNNEQVLSPVDNNSRREDVLDNNRAQQIPYSRNFQKVDEYEMKQQPLLVNNTGYPQPRPVIKHLGPNDISYGNLASFSLSPVNQVGHLQDNSNSLFSNQDPWNMPHDTHFPPPRPNKFLTRKEAPVVRDPFSDNRFGNTGESPSGNIIGGLTSELLLQDGVHQPSGNLDTDYTVQSNKGSAEENIKQELQAVAEGVAASVLNPDSAIHGRSGDAEAQNSDVEGQHTDNKPEDVKPKLPEKGNLGFPVSDGIGRLQIIKNIDLEELRELGSGTFGTVYHGKWRGSDVAIKRINERCFAGKPSEQDRMRDDFWNEAIKLADLHHPNVVAFYGVVVDGPGDSVATVTEYMVNGSLRTALQKNKRNLDKRKRLLIAMDVAFGMEYLHGKNIVHFDLKSDNLLVNLRDPHRPICKVGDLGLSKVKCQTLISGGVRGTLPWMAPELLNGDSSLVSEKVDVFSFGIVLWELLTGDEPYAELHYGAIIGGIVSNTLRPPVPENCDPEWKSLMERCWSAEPTERLNFTEIADQLRSMAAKLPSKAQAQQQQQPTSTQTQIMN